MTCTVLQSRRNYSNESRTNHKVVPAAVNVWIRPIRLAARRQRKMMVIALNVDGPEQVDRIIRIDEEDLDLQGINIPLIFLMSPKIS